jgi:sugar phosphate isomerase/epimerase
VRIAVENGNFDSIRHVLSKYGPDFVGICYDSGHGNLDVDGLGKLDAVKDRLIALHLHDNDGTGDQHNLVFSGAVDWPRLASIIAASAYRRCVSMESNIHKSGIKSGKTFLSRAFRAGTRFAGMIADQRERRRTAG